jgi:hypothetical protein
MLENLDKLRKAPQPVKEHLVSVITIGAMALITVVWFLFSIQSFLKNGTSKPAPSAPVQTQTAASSTGIKAPFAL